MVDLADSSAESAGESLLRLLLVRLRVRFEAQHWVRAGPSTYYRVDFYLPDLGVVLEFDGMKKYGRHVTPDRPGEKDERGRRNLEQEKHREDDLRAEGFGVGRVVWSGQTSAHVRTTIQTAAEQAQAGALRRPPETPPWA